MVQPETFKTHVAELNRAARRKVRLLKEKELGISDEAERLLASLKDEDVLYLHRQLIRA